MDKFETFVLIAVILSCSFMFFFGVMFTIKISAFSDSYEASCEKIGMEYHNGNEFDYCIDSKGNANYVKIDCNKIRWNKYDCYPTIINVGDVRTIRGLR